MSSIDKAIENLINSKKGEVAADSKKLFIGRDFSWLDFNRRVLQLSIDKEVPFLERLKFLAISSSNLDEFIRVRLTALYRDARDNPDRIGISGISFDEEFVKVLEGIKDFRTIQNRVYYKLVDGLKKRSVNIAKVKNLDGEMTKSARKIFMDKILPSLTPITYESTKEIPFVKSGDLALIVEASEYKYSKTVFTFIPISKVFDRLICIDSETDTYVMIEDLIKNNIQALFNKKKIHYVGLFRVLREGDIQLDTNNEISIVDRMVEFLYRREKSDPIFLEIEEDMPKNVLKVIKDVMDIKNKFIYKTNVMDLKFLSNVPAISNESFKPFEPQQPQEFIGQESVMEAMIDEDIMICHPYDSYDPVVRLLEEAAVDPRVMVIRNTLYRVSSENSPIVNALCKAARNGKQVCVLLELKARFDEEQNISIIEKMNRAGIQITYGLEKLKTHCKMLSILRNSSGELEYFTHVATGNYNDKTAKQYSDVSYFTCNRKIGDDVINIFNFISGFTTPNPIKSKRVFYSPKTLRAKIEALIENEENNVKRGKEGKVILKLNSISDKKMISRIYLASQRGVKFELIVRGICSIKPINKNIVIKSIVGRYLEHARIYYFYNGGKSKTFISSADFLTRNLDKRVELLVEVAEDICKRKLLNILRLNVKDTENSFYMRPDGTFAPPVRDRKNGIDVFDEMIKISKNEIYLPKKRKKI